MRFATSLILSLALAACTLFEEPRSDIRERAIAQLRDQEAIWDSLAIHDYDFAYSKICDCPSGTPEVRVEVRGDKVARVTSGAGLDITAQAEMRWPTVDSLFARGHAAVANRGLTIQITFDTTYHFPALIETFDQRNGDLVSHESKGLLPVTPIVLPSRAAH